jgi:hypothetical protein
MIFRVEREVRVTARRVKEAGGRGSIITTVGLAIVSILELVAVALQLRNIRGLVVS